ncbi:MAG TPA: trigger factor [Pyrinomonadaceae bacterium]|nr:trigger factor [Pyrinomonadaceae bacterium]
MKTEVVDVSPTRKELKIEIGADEVRAELEQVSRRYAAQANVPGFRKGHTPVSVVRTRFKNEIRGDVVQALVPRAVNEAIIESGLHVIGEPEIHLDPGEGLTKMGEAPLAIHAHVEVLPEVSLGEYKGIEAARRTRRVTDEMIEEFVEGIREQSAALVPVEDRASEEGDTVTVDFTGKYIDPPSEEEIKAEDVDVVIGGEGVLPVFAESLTGVRPDDVRTFTVKYPEDFSSKGLAGKEIEYTATVTAVRRKELPAADDEWARSLGEGVESVEDLRNRLREQLGARATFESDQRLRDELMAKLADAHKFELPDSLVEYQSRQILERTVRDMMQRGMDPRGQDINWEGLQDVMRSRAEDELRSSMLLERIADAENIEPTDEEIAQEIEAIAAATRQTTEQVRAALTKQGGERSIADRLRHRKALDVIVASAKVTDEEWRDETPAAEQAEARSGEDASAEAAKGGE